MLTRVWLLMLASAALVACSGPVGEAAASLAALREAAVYGADDRVDVFEHPDPQVRALALESTAAMVYQQRVTPESDGELRLTTVPLASQLPICDDQRFALQPTLAECSAVLVDRDLVLTAGHCLGDSVENARTRCREAL